jgi:N-acetylneuraminic acid mutarotase
LCRRLPAEGVASLRESNLSFGFAATLREIKIIRRSIMKKNITFHPNSPVLISLVLILFGAGTLDSDSTCYAQDSPWTQKADLPTARKGQSSCMWDGKIYVIGGTNTGSGLAFKKLEVYDPALDNWTSKADMLNERVNFSACVLNGKILAVGGSKTQWVDPIIEIEEYDPASNTWSPKTPMPKGRMHLTASIENGKIYIFGGADAGGALIKEVDVYDPVEDSWTTATDLPTPRMNLSSVVLNGRIYVIGGTFGASGGYLGLDIVEAYDPMTDTWSTKKNMNTKRKNFAACALDSSIYVFGGSNLDCGGILSSVETYDPITDTWTPRTHMPSILGGPSAASMNGKAYISGGIIAACPPTVVKSNYEYDPLLDSVWTNVESSAEFLPYDFALAQNYPNPFNPVTMIHYQLPMSSDVELSVFNLLGQKVATLVSEKQNLGSHQVEWDASGFASSVYYYRMEAGEFVGVKKMLLIR